MEFSRIRKDAMDDTAARKFNPVGLSEIFTFWSLIAPRTAFKGIEELRSRHYAVIENGRIKSEPYWSIMFPQAGNEDEA